MHSNKPTEVDSMNRLRVQAENKAALYRRALELACNGDADQVAYFVSEAGTAIDEERATHGVTVRFKCQGIDGRPLDCAEWCGDPKCHVGVAPSPQPIGFARQVENGNWVFIGFYEGRNPELPWQPVYLAPGVLVPDGGQQ